MATVAESGDPGKSFRSVFVDFYGGGSGHYYLFKTIKQIVEIPLIFARYFPQDIHKYFSPETIKKFGSIDSSVSSIANLLIFPKWIGTASKLYDTVKDCFKETNEENSLALYEKGGRVVLELSRLGWDSLRVVIVAAKIALVAIPHLGIIKLFALTVNSGDCIKSVYTLVRLDIDGEHNTDKQIVHGAKIIKTIAAIAFIVLGILFGGYTSIYLALLIAACGIVATGAGTFAHFYSEMTPGGA